MPTRLYGSVGTETGGIYSPGVSTAFYLITVKNAAATAINLTPESETGEAIEAVVRAIPSVIVYDIANAATGVIHAIADGHAAPSAAALQTAIQALGTTVGVNSIDVSGTTVQAGLGFTVSATAV